MLQVVLDLLVVNDLGVSLFEVVDGEPDRDHQHHDQELVNSVADIIDSINFEWVHNLVHRSIFRRNHSEDSGRHFKIWNLRENPEALDKDHGPFSFAALQGRHQQ